MDIELVKTMIDIGLSDLVKYKICSSAVRKEDPSGVKVELYLTPHFIQILRSHRLNGNSAERSIVLAVMGYAPEASEQDWSGMYAVIANCMGLIQDCTLTEQEDEYFNKTFKQAIKDRENV